MVRGSERRPGATGGGARPLGGMGGKARALAAARTAGRSSANSAALKCAWQSTIVTVVDSAIFFEGEETRASPASEEQRSWTRAEVAQHDSPQSLWAIYEGHVYDLTAFVKLVGGIGRRERVDGAPFFPF